VKTFVVLAVLGAPLAAAARDIPCGAVEPDVIQIDGLLNDWKDVPGLYTQDAAHVRGKSWDGPDDLSFITRCNYDERRLYLAIDVHDERLVRTRKAKPQEDHVVILFGAGRRLVIYPADLHADIPRVVKWGSAKKTPPGIEVAEAMQPKGWSVEVAIPWRLVPGWSPGVGQVRGAVAVGDADSRVPLKQDAMMSTAERRIGAFVLGEGDELYKAFLDAIGAKRTDVAFDRMYDMGGDPGLERVVRVGKVVGVIGKDYLYFEIPVQDVHDLKEFRVLDLAGDGKHSVVVRYVEHGGGGSRDVLAVWKIVGPTFKRTFACEVAKQIGSSRLENHYAFLARGRGHDIVVEAQPSSGLRQDAMTEQPADDMLPILLPWGEQRRARFRFRGDEYFPVEEKGR